MIDVLAATLGQGLIFGIAAMGIYLTFRILDFPDLSVDGSFTLGCAISAALLIKEVSPIIAILLAFIGGCLAGLTTALIHIKGKITGILSGIIVMIGLYSINLRIMGKSNIHLFSVDHMFSNKSTIAILVILILITLGIKILVDIFFKLRIGYVLKAVGENERFVESLGVNPQVFKAMGLMLSNGLVSVAGGLYVQYQGFSDINMGTGLIVSGLASIVIGEIVFKKMHFAKFTSVVIIGGIFYKLILMVALRLGFVASDLKLITALMMILILAKKPSRLFKKRERKVNSYVEISKCV